MSDGERPELRADPRPHLGGSSPSRESPDVLTWVALLFVIVIGVAGGNLLSNWITARVVAYQVERAAAELQAKKAATMAKNQKIQKQRQLEAAQRREENEAQMRSVRASGSLGKRFIRECQEWSAASRVNKSEAASEEAARRCRKKNQYLERGVWDSKIAN